MTNHPHRSPYFVSVEDVRRIAAESGLSHAEFCIVQMTSRFGDARCQAQREELERLFQAEWNARSKACESLDLPDTAELQ
jgi:hypothetical protein